MIGQLSDFLKDRTTVTRRIENVDSLEFPTLTFCINPSQKTSVAKEYNFTEHFDVVKKEVKNRSYAERLDKLSYILNRDYEMNMTLKESLYNTEFQMVRVEEGLVQVDHSEFDVKSIKSLHLGTCTKIQPLFEVTQTPFIFYLKFQMIPELGESDKPDKIIPTLLDGKQYMAWHYYS